MTKWKVVWPKQSHNNMEEQSGANLTSMTVSSHLHELKSSGVGDCNAMTNPPPTGGGLEAGEQEPPSTSDIELEDDVLPPDKGKGKAVSSDTAWGGSGHDPPRDWEIKYHLERWSITLRDEVLSWEMKYHLERWNESVDCSWSHSVCCCLTTRSDGKEILDGFLSKMDELERDLNEAAAEAKRRVEEVCATTWSSIAELCQCIKVWKEGHSLRDVETSCSQDSLSQTHHTHGFDNLLWVIFSCCCYMSAPQFWTLRSHMSFPTTFIAFELTFFQRLLTW